MTSRQFAGFQTPLHHEPDLLGVERLANELIDRRRRDRLLGQHGLCLERQDANDIGMGDAEIGKKLQSVAAGAVLGQHDIDMRVR